MRIINQIIAACVYMIVSTTVYAQLKYEMDEIEKIWGPFPKTEEERIEFQKSILVLGLYDHMRYPEEDSEEKIDKIYDKLQEINCLQDGGKE